MTTVEGATKGREVQGTRIHFPRHVSPGALAFELSSLVLAPWAALWFIGLFRACGHVLDDDNIGPNVVGTVFFLVVAGVAWVGFDLLRDDWRRVVLDSECPCCGVKQRRDFGVPGKSYRDPAACGACTAYLRNRGTQVHEESLDAISKLWAAYEVPPARYQLVARTDPQGFVELAMPPGCAACGAPDTDTRFITDFASSFAPASIEDPEGEGEGVAPRRGKNQSESDVQHERLIHLKARVCAQHSTAKDPYQSYFQRHDGAIGFSRYATYKAFCALHGFDKPA